jgi:hypothetical protein
MSGENDLVSKEKGLEGHGDLTLRLKARYASTAVPFPFQFRARQAPLGPLGPNSFVPQVSVRLGTGLSFGRCYGDVSGSQREVPRG